ncbi:unnamed protein product [Closterium sp. NIES-65]|nr:unnamed protein product [Closterium sp. NIES-65]
MSQVSAEFTRKSSSTSESGNLLTPDLVNQELSSDEADADEPGAVRNLPLAPEAGPQTDIGSADGQLPVTLAPALEAADEVDNEPGASEDDDDSGNNDRPSPRRKKGSVAAMHAEVVQEVDKAQAAASDHQRTVELQQETLADVRRQLEESQRANQLLRASSSAPTSALPPTSRSPNAEVNVASTSRGHNAKCNQAVLYFIAEAPPREINFWPEPQELRQQLIRTYRMVNVSEETFNLVMNSHPERERILKDKVGERRGNLFTQVKTWAYGPGGFVRESKIPMLAAENMAPVQRRNVQQWHLFYFDAVYGSKWHCNPDTGRPFANKAFDMALCKGLGGRRCKTMFAKILVVATICHVVEWPMANAGSRDTPALDGSDSNNKREVQLKVGVIIDWIKDRLSRGDNIYRDTAPAGFQMGANSLVRIVIAGFEDEFAGLLP